MRFTKMHGLGNDYVYVNCFEEKIDNPVELARLISDRHFGIGSDGLILLCPSQHAGLRMRIFNADGSEAQMCGNGLRCAAKYAYEKRLAEAGGPLAIPSGPAYPKSLKIETGNGVLTVGLAVDSDDKVQKVCVNMGEPILEPKQIPVKLQGEKIVSQPITVANSELLMTCVSMGNPHAVFFCDDVEEIELERIGPEIENHQLFPERVNVHFVEIVDQGCFKVRAWERGSGITLACGTGACACCVAGVLTNRTERVCRAELPGGWLDLIFWSEDNCVYMTGPAVEVFTGNWP